MSLRDAHERGVHSLRDLRCCRDYGLLSIRIGRRVSNAEVEIEVPFASEYYDSGTTGVAASAGDLERGDVWSALWQLERRGQGVTREVLAIPVDVVFREGEHGLGRLRGVCLTQNFVDTKIRLLVRPIIRFGDGVARKASCDLVQ